MFATGCDLPESIEIRSRPPSTGCQAVLPWITGRTPNGVFENETG